MIEISYPNVMNGLNKGIHMRLLCETRSIADHLFHRAVNLWYIPDFPDFTKLSRHSLSIVYGIDKIEMQFQVFEAIYNHNWRDFRGIYMIHPDLKQEAMMPRFANFYDELELHNERLLERWRA